MCAAPFNIFLQQVDVNMFCIEILSYLSILDLFLFGQVNKKCAQITKVMKSQYKHLINKNQIEINYTLFDYIFSNLERSRQIGDYTNAIFSLEQYILSNSNTEVMDYICDNVLLFRPHYRRINKCNDIKIWHYIFLLNAKNNRLSMLQHLHKRYMDFCTIYSLFPEYPCNNFFRAAVNNNNIDMIIWFTKAFPAPVGISDMLLYTALMKNKTQLAGIIINLYSIYPAPKFYINVSEKANVYTLQWMYDNGFNIDDSILASATLFKSMLMNKNSLEILKWFKSKKNDLFYNHNSNYYTYLYVNARKQNKLDVVHWLEYEKYEK